MCHHTALPLPLRMLPCKSSIHAVPAPRSMALHLKGVWPYTIWYRMQPRLQMSEARPTWEA